MKRENQPELSKEEIENLIKEETVAHPLVRCELPIDIVRYKRAILKIAYELTYYWLGESYLDDQVGELIRLCISDSSSISNWSEKYSLKGTIDFVGQQSAYPFWNSEPNSHIAFMSATGGSIGCYVRIFKVFEGRVVVSNNSSLYSNFVERFVAIDPQTGVTRESDLATEIIRFGSLHNIQEYPY